jgi:vancomycin resistance protein YoaR
MPNADVDLGNVAQAASTSTTGYLTSADWNTFNNKLGLADVRFTFVSDSGTTYIVPASSVTAAGKTIIELSNNSLTNITVATTTATGKSVGDSVNISITGTYNAQVLVAGAGVVLEGDLVFYYPYQTKTLILKNASTNTWKVVG